MIELNTSTFCRLFSIFIQIADLLSVRKYIFHFPKSLIFFVLFVHLFRSKLVKIQQFSDFLQKKNYCKNHSQAEIACDFKNVNVLGWIANKISSADNLMFILLFWGGFRFYCSIIRSHEIHSFMVRNENSTSSSWILIFLVHFSLFQLPLPSLFAK